MSEEVRRIIELLDACTGEQQRQVFDHLRRTIKIHSMEEELGITAETVLESLSRASDLTRRMIRGVFAEAAFDVEVVRKLKDWRDVTPAGDLPFDFQLADEIGTVSVQVKLQRSKKHRPMKGSDAPRWAGLSPDVYVVETQKTRSGVKGSVSTRPYRYGEFDVLAVSMYPSTRRWDHFMYTVSNWLLPDPSSESQIMIFQPVAETPNLDWTLSFSECVDLLRSEQQKTIAR